MDEAKFLHFLVFFTSLNRFITDVTRADVFVKKTWTSGLSQCWWNIFLPSFVPFVIFPSHSLWSWLCPCKWCCPWALPLPPTPFVPEEQRGAWEGWSPVSAMGNGTTWLSWTPHLWPRVSGCKFVQEHGRKSGQLPGALFTPTPLLLLSAGAALGYFWHKS